MSTTKPTLFSEIEEVIKTLNPETISVERKTTLRILADYIQSKTSNHQEVKSD